MKCDNKLADSAMDLFDNFLFVWSLWCWKWIFFNQYPQAEAYSERYCFHKIYEPLF